MKITIVGSGDAFATGGRAHTCFRIETETDAGAVAILVDFGAASIVSWKKLGLRFDAVESVVVSHLHGDHFGGLPFLLLDCQFVERRAKPLALIGPPGFGQSLDAALETLFPGAKELRWSFPWSVEEQLTGRVARVSGFAVETYEVLHAAGGLSTGVRISDGKSVFAYSGDTGWTNTLFDLSDKADLFVCECYSGADPTPHHMDWPTLRSNLPGFSAKRMVLTHLGESALARRAEMEQAGLTIAYDGQVFDL